jgi:hypothetical protein
MINLQAYPGEQFSLQIVVVGGDLGTTTGTVYASFLYQNSTSVSTQQLQTITITQNSECSVLHFSVYSNESDDVLFIKNSAVDYYIEYIEYIKLKVHRIKRILWH